MSCLRHRRVYTCHSCGKAEALIPDASKLISGSPEQLLATCRADLDRARASRRLLLASKSSRKAVAELDDFEAVTLTPTDTAQRATLAHEVLSSKPAREAAEVCEQENYREMQLCSADQNRSRRWRRVLPGHAASNFDARVQRNLCASVAIGFRSAEPIRRICQCHSLKCCGIRGSVLASELPKRVLSLHVLLFDKAPEVLESLWTRELGGFDLDPR